MEAHTLPSVKQTASGDLVYDSRSSNLTLCDNLERWDGVGGGGRFKRAGTYIYLWLIHVGVWQKHNILPIKNKSQEKK